MSVENLEDEYVMRDRSMFSVGKDIAIALGRQNDICPGCGRTKKACQDAGGSGCDLR